MMLEWRGIERQHKQNQRKHSDPYLPARERGPLRHMWMAEEGEEEEEEGKAEGERRKKEREVKRGENDRWKSRARREGRDGKKKK